MPDPVCGICASARGHGVPCARCDLPVCRPCARRCLEEGYTDAQHRCVRCGRPWSLREAVDRLGRTYVSTVYRRLRRAALLRAQLLRLDETAALAARVREERELQARARALALRVSEGELEHLAALRAAQHALGRLRLGGGTRGGGGASAPSLRARRCAHAGCGGFLPTGGGACFACGRHTCLRCDAPLSPSSSPSSAPGGGGGEAHVCDPADLLSRARIRDECRPCVRCAAPSARVEGCPVMWCPHCHCFWHWDTGREIDMRHQPPHNPDHRQWVTTGAGGGGAGGGGARRRELDDLPCGGMVDAHAIHAALLRDVLRRDLDVTHVAPLVLSAAHAISAAQRLRLSFPLAWDDEPENRLLRVALINGEATEDKVATALERNERAHRFRREVGELLETFVHASLDVLHRMTVPPDEEATDVASAFIELDALCDVAREAIDAAGALHGRAAPKLRRRASDGGWEWTRARRAPPPPLPPPPPVVVDLTGQEEEELGV